MCGGMSINPGPQTQNSNLKNPTPSKQVWRALERSDLAVIVLDARCPLFHLSLPILDYIQSDMRMDAVILINKCDLVPPGATRAWVEYFGKEMSGVPAVAFYAPKSMSGVVGQPCVEQFLDAVKRCKVPEP